MTMRILSAFLLHAQRARFAAAEAERRLLREPQLDTPDHRAGIASAYDTARLAADHFIRLADRHPAANDALFPLETA